MSTVFHVMKEEFERLQSAEASYRKAMEALPAGAPRIRHLRNNDYLYLTRRQGGKVVTVYVGPVSSEKAQQTLEQLKKRKRYSELVKQIKSDIKDVRKVLRGKI